MTIGVIGPSEKEIIGFISKIENRREETYAKLKFYSGSFKGIDVVSLYSGVCKVNAAIAAQILIDRFKVTSVIVVGVAGGINKDLNIGDIVVATQTTYHDVKPKILTEYHPWMKDEYFKCSYSLVELGHRAADDTKFDGKIYFGKIVTGEAFINNAGRQEIIKQFNPLCVDMETAAVNHVCYVNDVPFIAIRAITDTDKHRGDSNFRKNSVSASERALMFLEKLLHLISIDKLC